MSDNCKHKFEARHVWKTIIPEAELLTLLRDDSRRINPQRDTAEIIRATVWHCYSHDICVNCGELVYPKDYKAPPKLSNHILRAVKVAE